MYIKDFAGMFAVILSLSIPIVAIVMSMIKDMKNKQRETELRLAMIQAGTDAETAKVLIETQQKKKHNKYSTLRWGCILLGTGLGAVCDAISYLDDDDTYFWFIIAAGMGIGLLTSFVIEYKLTKKEEAQQKCSEQQHNINGL